MTVALALFAGGHAFGSSLALLSGEELGESPIDPAPDLVHVLADPHDLGVHFVRDLPTLASLDRGVHRAASGDEGAEGGEDRWQATEVHNLDAPPTREGYVGGVRHIEGEPAPDHGRSTRTRHGRSRYAEPAG